MARELTPLQKTFLEVLFSPACAGDYNKAKKVAGYSDNTSGSEVVRGLKAEIEEAARDYFVANVPKAAVKLVGVLDNPSALGTQSTLAAAKEILDRVGIVKPEKVTVDHTGGVLLLPPKE